MLLGQVFAQSLHIDKRSRPRPSVGQVSLLLRKLKMAEARKQVFPSAPLDTEDANHCPPPRTQSTTSNFAPPPYAESPPPYTECQFRHQQGYLQQQSDSNPQPRFQQTSQKEPEVVSTSSGMPGHNLPYGPNQVVTTISSRRKTSKYFVHDLDTGKDYFVKERRGWNGCRSKTVIKESGGPWTEFRKTPIKTFVRQKVLRTYFALKSKAVNNKFLFVSFLLFIVNVSALAILVMRNGKLDGTKAIEATTDLPQLT